MQEAIDRGPHASAMDPLAMEQQIKEATDKEKKGQCEIILWDDIKDAPPPQLKISPIAMIPHKSRLFRAILMSGLDSSQNKAHQLLSYYKRGM
jgi:hypothetical protein